MAKDYGRGRRDSQFVPDVRGNNPHETWENSEHEGRRLNKARYETVGEVDRSLDARAARIEQAARQLGAVTAPASGGGLLGAFALFALGAFALHLITKKDGPTEVDDDDEIEPVKKARAALPPAPAVPVGRRRRRRVKVAPAVVTTTTIASAE
jgi:hypothetical protein